LYSATVPVDRSAHEGDLARRPASFPLGLTGSLSAFDDADAWMLGIEREHQRRAPSIASPGEKTPAIADGAFSLLQPGGAQQTSILPVGRRADASPPVSLTAVGLGRTDHACAEPIGRAFRRVGAGRNQTCHTRFFAA